MAIQNIPLSESLSASNPKINANFSELGDHAASTANPHGVTASQAGALTQAEADALYKAIGYIPAWAEITGKPTAFPPEDHAHAKLDRLPDAETSQRTVYVSPTGSDTTGDGSSTAPWATIQYAVDQARTIMQQVNARSSYKVVCAAGTYDAPVVIPANLFGSFGNLGQGGIWIVSASGVASDVLITSTNSVSTIRCYGSASIDSVTVEGDGRAILVQGHTSTLVYAYKCTLRRRSLSNGGSAAIAAEVGRVVSHDNRSVSGQLFNNGLDARFGALVSKLFTQPTGAVANEVTQGGLIF